MPVAQLSLPLVDTSRRAGSGPRVLTTSVWYPAAPGGPFPLVVFAHGYNVTPAPYAGLLQSWARAGYVVAAPTLPLTNPGAGGGPDAEVVQQATIDFLDRYLKTGTAGQLLHDASVPGVASILAPVGQS